MPIPFPLAYQRYKFPDCIVSAHMLKVIVISCIIRNVVAIILIVSHGKFP